MSKKKAIICTSLFAVVIIGIVWISILIKPHNCDVSLFGILAPGITMLWLNDQVIKFYNWLRRER